MNTASLTAGIYHHLFDYADHSPLLDSYLIGHSIVKNRIFMAPMTRLRAEADGSPNALMREYYAQRASAGLIITEGTYLDRTSIAYANQPGIETAKHVSGWKAVTRAVHEKGGKIALQLHHAGRITHPLLTNGWTPVAPSAVKADGEIHTPDGKQSFQTPRELDVDEIAGIIDLYAAAAKKAVQADFDFVEIHAANGYLPHTFLSNRTNLRTDRYGGSIENRARFVIEIAKAISDAIGPERVGIKFNIGEFPAHDIVTDDEPQLYPYVAKAMQAIGIAHIHIQQPITNWGIADVDFDPLALFRRYYTGTLIAGGALDFAQASGLIAADRADASTFGRAWLANPDLVERFKTASRLNEADPTTFYSPGPKGYTDYPSLTTQPA